MTTQTRPLAPSPQTAPRQDRSSAEDDAPSVPHAGAPAHESSEEVLPRDLHRPHTLTVIAVALLFVLLLAGLFFVGWLPHESERKAAQSDAIEQSGGVPIVTVARPTQGAPSSALDLPCDVHAYQETAIYPRTSGYLKKLYVDIQSTVTAGQLLAEIESPEVDAQLAQAQGALAQAKAAVVKSQAELDLARHTLERYQELRNNVVTRQEIEEKESAQAQAIGDLAQAQANVTAAQATVDRFTTLQSFEKVTAPFDGVITERNYDVGALLSATETATGREMFRIAEVDKLRVFVNVPQVYIDGVRVGDPASLSVRNHPQTLFQGAVVRSADALQENTRTMPFELDFPNKDGQLYAGMYGTAHLRLSQEHPVLMIPTASLRFDAGGVTVATVREGKIHLQNVQPGRDLGTELEIVSGLSADDEVVNNPGEQIAEGSPVKVAEPAKDVGVKPVAQAGQVSIK